MRRKRVLIGLGIVGGCLIVLLAGISFGQQGGGPGAPPLPPLPPPEPHNEVIVPPLAPMTPGTPQPDQPRRMPVGPTTGADPLPPVPDQPPMEGTAGKEMPSDKGAGQTNDNPTGRQEPAVSLEWIGPPIAKVGQPLTYQILIKNITNIAVHQVVVRNQLPAGVTVNATDPKAAGQGNLLVWDLGTLEPPPGEATRYSADCGG